jgi:hypothetical protein
MNDEPDDILPPPVKPPYQPLPRMKRLAITLALLFTIWAIFTYAVPYFISPTMPATPAPARQVALPSDVNARIDALETRIKALEEQQLAPWQKAETAPPDPRVNDLSEKISTQQNAVEELKKSIDASDRRLAALTLFGQMKEAALSGDPYRGELREFTALMQGQDKFVPLLATLSPNAESGLPTTGELQSGFEAAMDKAFTAHSGTWSEKIHTLIRVRKVGESQQGGDDESVFARAEAKLQQGNIAQAVKELEGLSPPAADAMANWKSQAMSYIEAKAALDALQVALFTPATTTP